MQDLLIADLLGGPHGLRAWKSRSSAEKKIAAHLRKVDFSCADLIDVNLFSGGLFDFGESIFDSANLSNANLSHCILRSCSFRNSVMNNSCLTSADAGNADFTGATMGDANLSHGQFSHAKFCDVNLKGADLSYADFCGADLSDVNLADAKLLHTYCDEFTKWPLGFKQTSELVFRDGKNLVMATPAQPQMGFREFVSFIETELAAARVDKAIDMLKGESFQLFVDLNNDSIVGVVKSQTNWELVYSCLLRDTGDYSCCTQNLRRCGGLMSGTLCKHILVLILGLAQKKQIDVADACNWILASKEKKPAIDKDKMTAAFLRYQGAAVGEVDWRPTETVPEDFYTF